MTRRGWLGVLLALMGALFFAIPAQAHLGSADVFYEGMAGSYPVQVTIRMPTVVPGRAQITTRVLTGEPVDVSFLPLYSQTAVSNAPPPDAATLVFGETNLYTGQLWLMRSGSYSIQVNVHGRGGDHLVEVPVNSAALSQLPLPRYLKTILCALGVLLILGGIAVVAGAARESVLPADTSPGPVERRKGWCAGAVTFVILTLALWLGASWWKTDEQEFRRHLQNGGWPDLTAQVELNGDQPILDFKLGAEAFDEEKSISLAPDHGKLMHLYLIREGAADAFAHLHPRRKHAKEFQVPLPPLPPGHYKILCDLTLANSGRSSTATNSIDLPRIYPLIPSKISLPPDPDNSWATYPPNAVPPATAPRPTYTFPDGAQVTWLPHPSLRANQDAALHFQALDASSQPLPLQPYMGMFSHAVIWRRDGAIFAHLHPAGNFSMATQGYFQDKLAREGLNIQDPNCGITPALPPKTPLNTKTINDNVPTITLPYQFPAPGDYRIWVQFKTEGQIRTAIFDTTVSP